MSIMLKNGPKYGRFFVTPRNVNTSTLETTIQVCYRQQQVVVNGVKSDWAPVVSGVPQGTVLGSLLFSLHINDITADIESEIRLFADDCVCYREIKDKEDTLKLQRDIDRLGNWARKWGMRFQPVKCNTMQLTRKHLNKIQASYSHSPW